MDIVVKGGKIVDGTGNAWFSADVCIDKGRIVKVGRAEQGNASETIDASGLIVCPGFIDMHTHLREPGFEYKEDIETGSRAAASKP
jgi:dihydroorotase-like cyclic amidohydrolase